MKIRGCFLAAMVLSTSIALADTGNWWLGLTKQQKVSYCMGLCEGLIVGEKAKEFVWLNNADPRQLAEGLDRFYADFRNRGIQVAFAAEPVMMAMEGQTAAKIQSEITALRQFAATNHP